MRARDGFVLEAHRRRAAPPERHLSVGEVDLPALGRENVAPLLFGHVPGNCTRPFSASRGRRPAAGRERRRGALEDQAPSGRAAVRPELDRGGRRGRGTRCCARPPRSSGPPRGAAGRPRRGRPRPTARGPSSARRRRRAPAPSARPRRAGRTRSSAAAPRRPRGSRWTGRASGSRGPRPRAAAAGPRSAGASAKRRRASSTVVARSSSTFRPLSRTSRTSGLKRRPSQTSQTTVTSARNCMSTVTTPAPSQRSQRPPSRVEAEGSLREPARLRGGRPREERADLVPRLRDRRGVRARGAPERRLVDEDDVRRRAPALRSRRAPPRRRSPAAAPSPSAAAHRRRGRRRRATTCPTPRPLRPRRADAGGKRPRDSGDCLLAHPRLEARRENCEAQREVVFS